MTFNGDTAVEVGAALARADLSDRDSFYEAVEAVKKYARAKMKKSKSSAVGLPGGKLEALERKYAHLGYHDVFYLARLELNFPASAIHLPRPSSPVRRRLVEANFTMPDAYKVPGPGQSSSTPSTATSRTVRATPAPQQKSKASSRSAMRMHGALLAPEEPRPVQGLTAPLDLDYPVPPAPTLPTMPLPVIPCSPPLASAPIPIATPSDARYTRPEKQSPEDTSGPPIPRPPQRHSNTASDTTVRLSAPSVTSHTSGHSVRSVTPEDADTHIRALFNALPPEAQALAFHRLAAMQGKKEVKSGEQQRLAARAASEALEEAEVAAKKAVEEQYERYWERKKVEGVARVDWGKKKEEERVERENAEREKEEKEKVEMEKAEKERKDNERERERARELAREQEEQERERQQERLREQDRLRERARQRDRANSFAKRHAQGLTNRESSVHRAPPLPHQSQSPTAVSLPPSPANGGTNTFGNSPASPATVISGSTGSYGAQVPISVPTGTPLPPLAFPHPPRGLPGPPPTGLGITVGSPRQPPAGRPPAPPGPATRPGDGEDVRRVLEARIRALQHALADLDGDGVDAVTFSSASNSRKGSESTIGSSRRGSGPERERRQGSVHSLTERRKPATSSSLPTTTPPLTSSSVVDVPSPQTPGEVASSLAETNFFPRVKKVVTESPTERGESPPPGYDTVTIQW